MQFILCILLHERISHSTPCLFDRFIVLHPNVEEDIDSDLELIRIAAWILDKYEAVKGFRYLNVEGAIDEFSSLLKLQLDLRTEAANLVRFNENFADIEEVTFPKVSRSSIVSLLMLHTRFLPVANLSVLLQLVQGYRLSKDVLIMSYCDGIPILQFARENRDDPELLRRMCELGISSICKMIFEDNFLHGDLHPGNVLISPTDHKFIVLDVGMVSTGIVVCVCPLLELLIATEGRLLIVLYAFIHSLVRVALLHLW